MAGKSRISDRNSRSIKLCSARAGRSPIPRRSRFVQSDQLEIPVGFLASLWPIMISTTRFSIIESLPIIWNASEADGQVGQIEFLSI
jgi:hypothetical protein